MPSPWLISALPEGLNSGRRDQNTGGLPGSVASGGIRITTGQLCQGDGYGEPYR
jgi:hypothetical protein